MEQQPRLMPGDPVPWFSARSSVHAKQSFDTVAGRYVVVTFMGEDLAASRAAVAAIGKGGHRFDDSTARWYIVTADAADQAPGMLPLRAPAVAALFDPDRAIHKLFGAAVYGNAAVSFLLSPRLQVIAIVNDTDPGQHAQRLFALLGACPALEALSRSLGPPPIMIIPDVFEAEFCRLLIDGYRKHGGEPSGFMRDEGGRTVLKFDDSFKVRRDWEIVDAQINNAIGARFQRRVVPEVQKGFNFTVTHMERHLVSCYDAREGGHFGAHRDNTAKGTVHRRFACTVNLNAEDYEGGDLRFPEFGPQVYRPPTGACAIFSCSLLHQATKVTRGTRYAFLPFLHDAAAERIRDENRKFLDLEGQRPGNAAAATGAGT